MDVRALLASFVVIFLSEMGDKTQIMVISLTADRKAPFSVWLGSVTALALTCGFGVLFGHLLQRFISETVLRYAAGLLFVVFGILMLLNKV